MYNLSAMSVGSPQHIVDDNVMQTIIRSKY